MVCCRSILFIGLFVVASAVPAAKLSSLDMVNQAMLMAAEAGRHDLVAYMLDRGAQIEVRDTRPQEHTALMLAAAHGHSKVLELLLEHGAVVDARATDHSTALMQAASAGHVNVIKQLLKRGAD
ncbi:MAG: ankyrin repeat domain-containing protein, partial [Nitrospiraceae bacterium]